MSIKPTNRYQREKSANEQVKEIMTQYIQSLYPHRSSYIKTIQNTDIELQKKGVDLFTHINDGSDIKIYTDCKYNTCLRDNNYDTVWIEMGTYQNSQWETGWAYNDEMTNYIAFVVPLDDGWEQQNMQNYVIYICLANKIRNLCDDLINKNLIPEFCYDIDKYIQSKDKYYWEKKHCFDEPEQIYFTYEKKTQKPDGMLKMIKIKDIFNIGIVVKNGKIIFQSPNFEAINKYRQDRCYEYRYNHAVEEEKKRFAK